MMDCLFRLRCDTCRRALVDPAGADIVLPSRETLRRLAKRVKWTRTPRSAGSPGYDLCERCSFTEGRREGL